MIEIKDVSNPITALDGDLLSDSRPSRFHQGNRASVTLSRH